MHATSEEPVLTGLVLIPEPVGRAFRSNYAESEQPTALFILPRSFESRC